MFIYLFIHPNKQQYFDIYICHVYMSVLIHTLSLIKLNPFAKQMEFCLK